MKDHFQLSGQGLIAMPGIPLGVYEGAREINLLLSKPDGSQAIEKAEIYYSFPVPTPIEKMYTVLFRDLTKDNVPIDTEIWCILK